MDLMSLVPVASLVFASTNLDDIVLLSILFADSELRPGAIVAGQFVGIGLLVLVSAVASVAAVAIPAEWTALLGALPLVLGLFKAAQLVAARAKAGDDDDASLQRDKPTAVHAQVAMVVGITVANGGDNLSVYVPMFAANRHAIGVYATVFAIMTGLWCTLGYKLVRNPVIGSRLQRYGHVALPFVLVALGLHILSGALPLLR